MKNLPMKNLIKKTNTLYRYNHLSGINLSETIVGETDPTNTMITILTTVSGQTHFSQRNKAVNLRV
jgi:hypothetical protein